MTKAERFKGCILCGAIGDALGSGYENLEKGNDDSAFLFGTPKTIEPDWQITDDTQLTLATIESMSHEAQLSPELVSAQFLKLYKNNKLRGIGASTLKALKELDIGMHWSQVGRRGEYAAGNGAAMRIAPLAFQDAIDDSLVNDICNITHSNDEAYIGAKAIVIAIKEILNGNWMGNSNLFDLIIKQIPDTKVRDRLIEIKDIDNLTDVGRKGKDGYVVNSVPLAIAAANKVSEIGIERMFSALIEIGGDTDTNCSIAGQIAGTLIGRNGIPQNLILKLKELDDFDWIQTTMTKLIAKENWL